MRDRWTLARAALALSLGLSWLVNTRMAAAAGRPVPAFLTAAVVALLPAFVLARRREWAGAGLVVLAWRLQLAVNAADPAHIDHSTVMPLLVLAAWTAARLLRREEEEAWDYCCALIGAMYFSAAVTKLRESGLAWADGRLLRVLVASEGVNTAGPLRGLRELFAASPWAARAGSIATLGIELGAVALVFRPTRRYGAVGLLGMHAMIIALMGIDWQFFPLVVAAAAL